MDRDARLNYAQCVGWLRNLFSGSQDAPGNPYVAEWERTRKGKPANDYISVKVTGEAQFQDALAQICGRKADEEVRVEGKLARLIPEPENPHDPNAIRVDIEGMTVGYVSRGNARTYHRRVVAMIEAGEEPVVPTWIGCHGPGAENPNIGLRLQIPRDSRLAARLG